MVLREKKPEVAEFIQQWRKRYQRNYSLNETAEQANLYEALVEIARHLASGSKSAKVSLTVNNDGVDGLQITVCPKT
jgi:hypothetical protein